jgi:hypothetical protein
MAGTGGRTGDTIGRTHGFRIGSVRQHAPGD